MRQLCEFFFLAKDRVENCLLKSGAKIPLNDEEVEKEEVDGAGDDDEEANILTVVQRDTTADSLVNGGDEVDVEEEDKGDNQDKLDNTPMFPGCPCCRVPELLHSVSHNISLVVTIFPLSVTVL